MVCHKFYKCNQAFRGKADNCCTQLLLTINLSETVLNHKAEHLYLAITHIRNPLTANFKKIHFRHKWVKKHSYGGNEYKILSIFYHIDEILYICTMPAKANFLNIDKLKQRYGKAESISLDEIYRFYKSVPKATAHWRIYKLVALGVLQRIGRGLYRIGTETVYQPEIPKNTKSIYQRIHQQFPYAAICAWHTSCLNEFTVHQPGKHSILIEAEKDVAESVFNFLSEQNKEVFFNPDKEVYQRYISGKKEGIIIIPLISQSPTQVVNDVHTTTIEKILVDIFSDNVVFAPFQGNEMRNIFVTAMQKYTVNISTLKRYAFRRGKQEELERYIAKLDLRQ